MAARLPALTGLRFFLALWVIIFHQSFPWFGFSARGYLLDVPLVFPSAVSAVISTGYFAVGVFFVLSGFILSYNYPLAGRWRLGQFGRYLGARFARIYPVYGLGLFLIAPFILYPYIKWHWLQGALKPALLNVGLVQTWIPYLATSWNFPGWSVSNEACFYCCFPWVGLLLWRLSIWRAVAAIFALWVLAMAAPVAATSIPLSVFDHSATPGRHLDSDAFWSMLVQYNPILRLPEFCVGIVAGRIFNQLVARNSWVLGRGICIYGPALLFEVLAIAYGKTLPHLWLANGLFTPIHAMVIVGLALGNDPFVRVLSTAPMEFLGNASYAMYILHVPTFLWLNYAAFKLFGANPGGIVSLTLYLLLVCGLSAIVYQYLERPANRVLRRWFSSGSSDRIVTTNLAVGRN